MMGGQSESLPFVIGKGRYIERSEKKRRGGVRGNKTIRKIDGFFPERSDQDRNSARKSNLGRRAVSRKKGRGGV